MTHPAPPAATCGEGIGDRVSVVDRRWRYTYVNELALAEVRDRKGQHLTADDVVGVNCWEFLPELVGTTIHREFHRAMREQRPLRFEAYSEFSAHWVEIRAFPSDEGLSVHAHDITPPTRDEARHERRERQHALVTELGLRALATDDLQTLMDEAADLAARTLDVELAAVCEAAPEGQSMTLCAGVGWPDGLVGKRLQRQARDWLLGCTLPRGAPVMVENLNSDSRSPAGGELRAHGVVSALSVMIDRHDEPFGVLAALSTRRRQFSPSDVSFMQGLADVLASALERSRAQARLAEAGHEARRRIARHLHDDALCELTDALAQVADRGAAGLSGDAGERLIATLERIGRHLRGAIFDLRLTDDARRRWPEALAGLVEVHRARAVDCVIDVQITGEPPLDVGGGRCPAVLGIVDEALTNARRHSGARHVRVAARSCARGLWVEVTDDGCGFEPAAEPPSDSAGLQWMRDRSALLGGDLQIQSAPAAGTTVRLGLGAQEQTGAAATARVLLVDDHTAAREAIAGMLGWQPDLRVVGQAGSLAEARGLLEDVDVAIINLHLADGDGRELIAELRAVNPRARALVLCANLDAAETARAVSSGAAGTFDKAAHLDQVVDGVRRLRRGERLIPVEQLVELLRVEDRRYAQERDDRRAIETLTPRERQVLQGLADGLTSEAIAQRLGIALRTERNHIANILRKLGLHTQLQALVFGLHHQLVEIRRPAHAADVTAIATGEPNSP